MRHEALNAAASGTPAAVDRASTGAGPAASRPGSPTAWGAPRSGPAPRPRLGATGESFWSKRMTRRPRECSRRTTRSRSPSDRRRAAPPASPARPASSRSGPLWHDERYHAPTPGRVGASAPDECRCPVPRPHAPLAASAHRRSAAAARSRAGCSASASRRPPAGGVEYVRTAASCSGSRAAIPRVRRGVCPGVRPRCPDDRLRAPPGDVQAPAPAATRRAAASRCWAVSGQCSCCWRARRTRATTAASASCRTCSRYAPSTASFERVVSGGLQPGAAARLVGRLRRLDQRPAPRWRPAGRAA